MTIPATPESLFSIGKPLHRKVASQTYVQLLFEYLAQQGHDPAQVLKEPWPAAEATEADGLSIARWEELLERAECFLEDPLLPLHVGQTIQTKHLGVLGAVLQACDDLGAALPRLERYLRLVVDAFPMERRLGPGWGEIVWKDNGDHTGRRVELLGATVMVQFTRSLVRDPPNPMLVRFANAADDHVRAYEEYFGCPVIFDQQDPGIRFGLQFLSLPLKNPDPQLIALLEQHAERLLEQLPQQEECIEQVRKAISHALREGEPDVELISKRLNCSSRTLQRSLRRAGTSFRDELALVRRELATFYLRDPQLMIVDIALLLGYSEHSAFTRAYKSWTGRTPQEDRHRC